MSKLQIIDLHVSIEGKEILSYIVITFLLMSIAASFATTCYEQCFNYYIKESIKITQKIVLFCVLGQDLGQ